MSAKSSKAADEHVRQGLVLHHAGRAAEAERHYREALASQPEHPAANHLLGLLALQHGHASSAAELIAKAVRARPSDAQYLTNLGVALNASGEPAKAVASLDRAVDLKPDFAEAHSNRGMVLKALDRLGEADAAYRRAIALKPKEPGFHLNRANVLRELGDLLAAEDEYRVALRLRPAYPAAVSGLCQTLEALARAGEAVTLAETAVAAQPGSAEIHRALGRASRAAGQLEQSAAAYRRALEIDPREPEPWRQLAMIVRRSSRDAEMATMERLFADSRSSPDTRAQVGFALAKGFDDLGDSTRAFETYVESNRLKWSTLSFSLDRLAEEYAALVRQFEELADTAPADVPDDPASIFIVGLPRSGKTTLEGMLARHPDMAALGELSIFPALIHDSLLAGRDHGPPQDQLLRQIGAEYLRRTRELTGEGRRTIDTMPPNFRHVGFIRVALPNARIIHARREPFSHSVALFQKYFGQPGYEFTYEPGVLAGAYRLYRGLMARWEALVPGFVLETDLSAVLANPIAGMGQILDFCGLSVDQGCFQPFVAEPVIGGGDRPASSDPRARLAPYEAILGSVRE